VSRELFFSVAYHLVVLLFFSILNTNFSHASNFCEFREKQKIAILNTHKNLDCPSVNFICSPGSC